MAGQRYVESLSLYARSPGIPICCTVVIFLWVYWNAEPFSLPEISGGDSRHDHIVFWQVCAFLRVGKSSPTYVVAWKSQGMFSLSKYVAQIVTAGGVISPILHPTQQTLHALEITCLSKRHRLFSRRSKQVDVVARGPRLVPCGEIFPRLITPTGDTSRCL